MRILLLGGNGFIGKNLAQNLSEKHELIIYDKYIDSAYFQKLHVAPENLFMDDIQKFNSYFKKKCKKIDVIVHLISSISPASSMSDVISGYENDLLQSLKIINEIRDKNIKMIFFSSGGTVYGDKTGLITEEMTPKPLNHYGIIKHTLENILLMNNKVYGTNHIILRVSNPYGYNQLSKLNVGIIPIFAQKILKNEKILIYGDGEIVRDFIFIEDLVTMFELLINKFSTNYSIYNIGTGTGYSINQVIKILSKEIGKKPLVGYMGNRNIDVKENVLDISRFKNEFSFSPENSVEDGIKKYLEYIKNEVW